MIELITEMPANVVAFSAIGRVTGDDYQQVLVPAVEKTLQSHSTIRFLYYLGPEFKKFTTTALWDDAKVGVQHWSDFEKIAVVSDIGWIQTMVKGIGVTMPGAVRTFPNDELDKAKVWISE